MKFSKNDTLVTLIILILASGLLYLYIREVNADSRGTGERLGVIEFKRNVATRRLVSRLQWDRLKTQSPVFVYDVLLTGNDSEAEINFDDGALLSLFENTMIKLSPKHSDALFSMERNGSLLYKSGSSARGISVGGKTITVEQNSSVLFDKTDAAANFEVISGSVKVEADDGSVVMARTGEKLSINAETGIATASRLSGILLKPAPEARIQASTPAVPLELVWRETERPETSAGTLQLASDKNYKHIMFSSANTEIAADSLFYGRTECPAGRYYWRVVFPDGEVSPSRRFSIEAASVVQAVLPTDSESFSYKSVLPDIQFSWEKDAAALYYVLEIADNPDFAGAIRKIRAEGNVIRAASFAEGEYYWRVVPFYARNVSAPPPVGLTRRFTVRKSQTLSALGLRAPADASSYSTRNYNEKGLQFSWDSEPEADAYTILFYHKIDDAKPFAELVSKKAWHCVTSNEVPHLAQTGTYYWSVLWKDKAGAEAQAAPRRRIEALADQPVLRAVYPADGYRVSSSLVRNLRFAWRSDSSELYEFVAARDAALSTETFTKTVRGETYTGIELAAGDWYWAVRSYSQDGTGYTQSEPRKITVIDVLPAPRIIRPRDGSSLASLPKDRAVFQWEAVEYADYYAVSLYGPEGGRIVDYPFYKGTSLDVPLGLSSAGTYTMTVRAGSFDSELSSDIRGLAARCSVNSKPLRHVRLVTPRGNSYITGTDAARNGLRFVWESEDEPSRYELVVHKDGARIPKQLIRYRGRREAFISEASSGTYTWTVIAFSGQYDISPPRAGSFTVAPIPSLAVPQFAEQMPKKIDAAWLQTNRSIICSWEPVPGATSYSVALYKAGSRIPIAEYPNVTQTTVVFDALHKLAKGDFVWEVRAQNALSKQVAQKSMATKFLFTIDLPGITKPSSSDEGIYYGY